jgi:hypothetical protein
MHPNKAPTLSKNNNGGKERERALMGGRGSGGGWVWCGVVSKTYNSN